MTTKDLQWVSAFDLAQTLCLNHKYLYKMAQKHSVDLHDILQRFDRSESPNRSLDTLHEIQERIYAQ